MTRYMLGILVIGGLLGIMVMKGCSTPPVEKVVRKPPVVDSVAFHRYKLGPDEHMLLIDIPDKYVPRRCAVYVNELTNTSHFSCNFDDAGSPFPQAAEE